MGNITSGIKLQTHFLGLKQGDYKPQINNLGKDSYSKV